MKKKLEDTVNGEMVTSMEEIIQLGKQMENMRDGGELQENERIVDPKQFDDENI